MKTLKDLKEMISEPASKEWFAKHGLPKSSKGKALRHVKSAEEGKKLNEKFAAEGRAMIAKGRHERRHNKGKRTSKAERLSSMKEMSQGN